MHAIKQLDKSENWSLNLSVTEDARSVLCFVTSRGRSVSGELNNSTEHTVCHSKVFIEQEAFEKISCKNRLLEVSTNMCLATRCPVGHLKDGMREV